MASNSYLSAPAQAKMADILAHMEGRDYTTVPQLMQACNLHQTSVSGYLKHLEARELVHLFEKASNFRRGSHPAKWRFGAAPTDFLRPRAGMERRVSIRKQWAGKIPPMFEPMAHLFGRAA